MGNLRILVLLLISALCTLSPRVAAQQPAPLDRYFARQVDEISSQCLADIRTLDDWQKRRPALREQLAEMLGLSPMPPRTDLKTVVTGRIEQDGFIAEKILFQSSPGLYVTATLYRPAAAGAPLPAVLYLCGHGNVKEKGISYGSKAFYQHHPEWFARHGYVSLVLDTLQLAEIEGLHHGTAREGMWWWLGRGYTPAGVEAWNAIRALDYLQSRPEVDGARIGVTGRSGGGAYSWWVAALDERVGVAVPVAGITDLRNYVADGVISGHCDCMFMVNTHRWDFAMVAALVAPRPLLVANSDKDPIFPLSGVLRVHEHLRRIYRLYGAEDRLGLLITEGPHRDTQALQVPTFHWMNRWLKKEEPLIEEAAVKRLQPEVLRVLGAIPTDQQNTRIHEVFIAAAPEAAVPADAAAWEALRRRWLEKLSAQTFAGWPTVKTDLKLQKQSESPLQKATLRVYSFESQPEVPLQMWVLARAGVRPKSVLLYVVDAEQWQRWTTEPRRNLPELLGSRDAIAIVAARGIGPTAWDPKKDSHIRRRFPLIGQTLDGMRVWDVRRAVDALGQTAELRGAAIGLSGENTMAGVALYAALFEPAVREVELRSPTTTHRNGPHLLNVEKIFDLPQAAAMALASTRMVFYDTDPNAWSWTRRLADTLRLDPARLEFRK